MELTKHGGSGRNQGRKKKEKVKMLGLAEGLIFKAQEMSEETLEKRTPRDLVEFAWKEVFGDWDSTH